MNKIDVPKPKMYVFTHVKPGKNPITHRVGHVLCHDPKERVKVLERAFRREFHIKHNEQVFTTYELMEVSVR